MRLTLKTINDELAKPNTTVYGSSTRNFFAPPNPRVKTAPRKK